jgi:hypothetical protein
MAQSLPKTPSTSPPQDTGFNSQGDKQTSEVTSTTLCDREGMSAAVVPYRLYKRRWLGVFAMVSQNCSTCLFVFSHGAECWTVCARNCERRERAMVWAYIQQGCDAVPRYFLNYSHIYFQLLAILGSL